MFLASSSPAAGADARTGGPIDSSQPAAPQHFHLFQGPFCANDPAGRCAQSGPESGRRSWRPCSVPENSPPAAGRCIIRNSRARASGRTGSRRRGGPRSRPKRVKMNRRLGEWRRHLLCSDKLAGRANSIRYKAARRQVSCCPSGRPLGCARGLAVRGSHKEQRAKECGPGNEKSDANSMPAGSTGRRLT